MEHGQEFRADFALKNMTKDAIGYEMYTHEVVTGRSLIADTQKEIDELKRAQRNADRDGASYGMSKEAIAGMKAGIREKISQRQKAVTIMQEARIEYEKQKRNATTSSGNLKRRRNWL